MERDKSIHEEGDIQTKDISDWLECSVRFVQKWGVSNDLPFHRIRGVKHYLWDGETLDKFGEWFNGKWDKPKRTYCVKKPKREPKPRPVREKKTVTFTTVKDVVVGINMKNGFVERDIPQKTQEKYIQEWCRENGTPYENIGGRKYYRITSNMEQRLVDRFEPVFLGMALRQRENIKRHTEMGKKMKVIEKSIKERISGRN